MVILKGSSRYPLVDERGLHEDMYEFAGIADIVVCCLRQDKDTVKFQFPSSQCTYILILLLVMSAHLNNSWFSQVGIVDKKFLSSMKKASFYH